VVALLYLSAHGAQEYPIMDMVANKVVQKYQRASCEELWKERAERGQTRSPQEQHAIEILRNDPKMREAFINKDIADGLRFAFYIGQSKVVGGTTTDMVAYASEGVFVQIWIGAKDKLLRMARAVYRDDPSQLRHQLEVSDWKLDVPAPPDTFAARAAANATHIKFARPDPHMSPGAKLPARAKPPKKSNDHELETP